MPTEALEKERVLLLVDPVSCGAPALQKAMVNLHPDRHALTLLVVATAPPSGSDAGDPTYSAEFAYADAALAGYRRIAEEAGFEVDGWVTPDRRDQIIREIEASTPYDRALAVSPSGTWRRLRKRDVSRLLETAGLETTLHCTR